MTKGTEQQLKAFIKNALEFRHLLNCAAHDTDLTREEQQELLALTPFADSCVRLAHTLRRMIWKAWAQERKAEQQRKRAAAKRKQQRHRERTHKKTR